MEGAIFVIPLAALVVPIGLILLAVLVDTIALLGFAYVMWRDEWAIRLAHYLGDHFVRPLRRVIRPVVGLRPH